MTTSLSQKEYSEIFQTILKTIRPSREKTTRQFFVCPVGQVGSGKSMVLKALALQLPFVIVSTDDFRKELKARGFRYEPAGKMTMEALGHFTRLGFNVALDTNCGRPEKKKEIEKAAREFAAKVFWIQVAPPEEYIIHKLKNFKHTWLFRDAKQAVENYRNYKKLLEREPVFVPFLYTFDPSRSDLDRQAADAAGLMKKELGN